jgi:hypothetical protein
VTTVTLHGPSNDAASADVPAANIVTAKSVASVTARMEWLIMGTLVLWRLGPAPGCGRSAFIFIMGRAMVGLARNSVRRMVSRRHAAKEGVSPSVLLKWTASHPPHDHVIIVFDAGHACDPRRRRKFKR